MGDSEVFDTLSRQLTQQERIDMLDQLIVDDLDDIAPLEEDEGAGRTVDPQAEYERFGFFRRLMVILQTLLAGRPRDEVVTDLLLKELSKEILAERRDIIDFKRGLALAPFGQQLDDIRDCLERLERSMIGLESVGLGVLAAVILGIADSDTYSRLLIETDPFVVSKDEPDLPPFQIKKRCLRNLEDALLLLPADLQEQIEVDFVAYAALRRLQSLDLDVGDTSEAPLHKLKHPIVEITELLDRRRFVPSRRLLKALFLILRKTDGEAEQSMSPQEWGNHVTSLLVRLVDLKKDIPFTLIARYVERDLQYLPSGVESPGEWSAHLKRFWTGRLEKQYQAFVAEEKKRSILLEASEWISTSKSPGYPAVDPGETGTHAFSLAVLRSVLSKLASGDDAAALKTLLIEGNFYKDQNRSDFTDAHNGVRRRLEEISDLESLVGQDGDLTRRLESIAKQSTSAPTRRTQRRNSVREFDAEVEALIRRGLEDIRVLHDVVDGILYGEIGGRYDTLSNLTEIAGRGNKTLMTRLADIVTFLGKSREVLGNVFDVERNAARRRESLEARLN